jgi:hypothetical protein
MAYVYRHIRLDKNEPFYIGISRKDDHLYKRAHKGTNRNEHWHRIVSKTDYRVEILFDEIDFDSAKQKEIEFIKLYGRSNLNYGTLCNMTDGGEGTVNRINTDKHNLAISKANKGKVFSQTHRERLSKNAKNRSEDIINAQRKRLINIAKNNIGKKQSLESINKRILKNKGKKRSQEFKDRLSLLLTGKKMSIEARKKMSESKKGKRTGMGNHQSKIVFNTQNGIFYYSITEAAQSINMPRIGLLGRLNGKIKNKTYLTLV